MMRAQLTALRRFHSVLAVGGLLALFAGCSSPAVNDPARLGPHFVPTNYAGEARLPANFRRIVLLPLAGGTVAPAESTVALDAVFVAALQRQSRFEVVPISRAECLRMFHVEEFSSTAALPADFLAKLRHSYAADGVMFVDLTVFKAYRPMALGVRAKLATLGDEVRLVWTFDNLFAAADADVANSARYYSLDSGRPGVPGDPTLAVLDSPTRFASYVADAMFVTLPPVGGTPIVAPNAAKQH